MQPDPEASRGNPLGRDFLLHVLDDFPRGVHGISGIVPEGQGSLKGGHEAVAKQLMYHAVVVGHAGSGKRRLARTAAPAGTP